MYDYFIPNFFAFFSLIFYVFNYELRPEPDEKYKNFLMITGFKQWQITGFLVGEVVTGSMNLI